MRGDSSEVEQAATRTGGVRACVVGCTGILDDASIRHRYADSELQCREGCYDILHRRSLPLFLFSAAV